MNEPLYDIIPASRYSVRKVNWRTLALLGLLTLAPATLPDLARMLGRSMTGVWLDLNWLAQHAFIRVTGGVA